MSKANPSILASPFKLIFGLFIWGMIALMAFIYFGAGYLSYQIEQEQKAPHQSAENDEEELSPAQEAQLRQERSARTTTNQWSDAGGNENGWGD